MLWLSRTNALIAIPSMKTTAPDWNPLPVIFSGVLPPVEPALETDR